MVKFTLLPFNLSGSIYRSAMPYGCYDKRGEILQLYKEKCVNVIVNLAGDDECIKKAGRDLNSLYKDESFFVIPHPIDDYGIPSDIFAFYNDVKRVGMLAKEGKNIAIHCSGGIGRSGMFAACLAIDILGLSGDAAISWVRKHIDGAVETEEQEEVVRKYQ